MVSCILFATLFSVSICELAQTLTHCFYSGDWEFKEDEYAWFQKRSRDLQLTEGEFIAGVQQVKQIWVDAKLLMANINELTNLMIESNSEPTWWYEPRQSVADLIALSQTLGIALARGAEQVRINFA